jgi:3-hydroxyisobutyrate dehydrogenase-like beta-hydroxyacid dehydrogenase
VPLPVTHATSEWYDRAIDAGLGDDDFCGVVRLTEALAGTEVRGD